MPKPRRQKELKVKSRKLKEKIYSTPIAETVESINQLPAIEETDNGEDERKKKLIMWLGISVIMAALFVGWLFNLKYEFKANAKKSAVGGFDWSQAKVELDKTMTQVKAGINQMKQLQKNAASTTPEEPKLSPEQINLLKGKLLEEAATGAASSTDE